ncbi:YdaS family helix-turn-helix protein [Rhizobium hidalgonense]|uniref:YdaS family helix-turn-helix protein n=1 Tax=Rhizobium hidalgonense TaxID=1538159 RepID=A0AAJ2H1F2_9HYPH|nr:YdaS family helix-turn-helix protein [Rhizobium hidalgonense]MDR9777234.1 YdaS family helix-turn-helix protein [Rhizobium hidalgonense]
MTLDDFLNSKSPKMSHAAFAELIDASQATVSRYLNGDRFPPPETIRKIVSATKGKVTADDLLVGFERAKKAKASESAA